MKGLTKEEASRSIHESDPGESDLARSCFAASPGAAKGGTGRGEGGVRSSGELQVEKMATMVRKGRGAVA